MLEGAVFKNRIVKETFFEAAFNKNALGEYAVGQDPAFIVDVFKLFIVVYYIILIAVAHCEKSLN